MAAPRPWRCHANPRSRREPGPVRRVQCLGGRSPVRGVPAPMRRRRSGTRPNLFKLLICRSLRIKACADRRGTPAPIHTGPSRSSSTMTSRGSAKATAPSTWPSCATRSQPRPHPRRKSQSSAGGKWQDGAPTTSQYSRRPAVLTRIRSPIERPLIWARFGALGAIPESGIALRMKPLEAFAARRGAIPKRRQNSRRSVSGADASRQNSLRRSTIDTPSLRSMSSESKF